MTRRGSLAYYLASWVCGCFFMAATIWLGNGIRPTVPRTGGLLFVTYFFSLMFGAATSLLFGFFLRRTANRLRWNHLWHWLIGGAILAPLLIALLGAIASSNAQASGWRVWLFLPLTGPYMINGSHGWKSWLLAAPAGVATAWVLFRIDRAFGGPSSETTP
ncbi:MAG TPA: hypothetical protein VGS59_01230 [Candidatus Acidoferrales bacterium]|nr:hypothetical protein [Candidatus Acidoferrales bacterium]